MPPTSLHQHHIQYHAGSETDWEYLPASDWKNGPRIKAGQAGWRWGVVGGWRGRRERWMKAPPQFKVSVTLTGAPGLDMLLPPSALSGFRTS